MRFILNGTDVDVDAHPMKRLLDVLREDCGLTGTKEGCGEGECGACTVLVDDAPVCACLVPFAHVRAARVMTIEGLGGDHPLQRAFAREGGAQCGICTPGMIMAALALAPSAAGARPPSLARVRRALAGNLCRCTGYEAIYRAVRAGARWRAGERGVPGAPPESDDGAEAAAVHHQSTAGVSDSSRPDLSAFGGPPRAPRPA